MTDQTPVISGGAPTTIDENDANYAPQLVNPGFTVLGSQLGGGSLVISGLLAEDILSFRNQGTGAGQIGFNAATGALTFGGVQFATASGGVGADLTVTFLGSASAASVQALLQNLTYETHSDTPTASRQLNILLSDANGDSASGPQNSWVSHGLSNDVGELYLGSLGHGGSSRISFADWNGDGRADFASTTISNTTGVYSIQVGHWVQDGGDKPYITKYIWDFFTSTGQTAYRPSPTFIDYDGDGDPDLLVGQIVAPNNQAFGYLLYRNDGGTLNLVSDDHNPFLAWMPWGNPTGVDLDRDGDDDLVIANVGTVRYFRNDGGVFTEMTGAGNPFNAVASETVFDTAGVQVLTFLDMDGDGDLDAVGGYANGRLKVWVNSNGQFQDTGWNPLADVHVFNNAAPAAADLDGDGDIDLGVTDGNGWGWFIENTTAPGLTFTLNVNPQAENIAPTAQANSGSSAFENWANAGPVALGLTLDLNDADNNIGGGELRVSGLKPEDRISLSVQSGDIVFDAATGMITQNGVLIGEASGGVGTDFIIHLERAATTGAVEALAAMLTYATPSDQPSPDRHFDIKVTDRYGLSADVDFRFQVAPALDPGTLGGIDPSFRDIYQRAVPMVLDGDVTLTGSDGAHNLYIYAATGDVVSFEAVSSADGRLTFDGQTLAWNGEPFATIDRSSNGFLVYGLESQDLTPEQIKAMVESLTLAIPGAATYQQHSVMVTIGADTFSAATFNVTFQYSHDINPPALADLTAASFGENAVNAAPATLDADVTVTDVWNEFKGGSLVVSGLKAEDRVSFASGGPLGSDPATGLISWNGQAIGHASGGAGGTLTLAFDQGVTVTTAMVETIIEHLAFADVSDFPVADRTLTITATDSDGGVASGQIAVHVTAEYDYFPPTVSGFDNVTFGEGAARAAPQLLDSDVTVTFNTPLLAGGSVIVSGASDDVRIALANLGNGAGQIGYDAATGQVRYGGVVIGQASGGAGADFIVTLGGGATPAAVEALVEVLTLQQLDTTPHTSSALTITVTDGVGGSASGQIVVGIAPQDDAAVAQFSPPNFLEHTVNAGPQFVFPDITLTDPDGGNATYSTLTIDGLLPEDRLNFGGDDYGIYDFGWPVLGGSGAPLGNVVQTASGLTINFFQPMSQDQIQTVLRHLTYADVSDTPTPVRSLTITLSGSSAPGSFSFDLTVTPEHDAPVLSGLDNPVFSAADAGQPHVIDTDVSFTSDGSLAGGSLTVSGMLSEDVVAIGSTGGIAYTAGNGEVRFNGTLIGQASTGPHGELVVNFGAGATSVAVEALVESLTWQANGAPHHFRTLTYAIDDGHGGQGGGQIVLEAQPLLNHQPILVGLDNLVLDAPDAATPHRLLPAAQLADADGSLDGGVLRITGLLSGDQIGIQTGSGIAFDSATGAVSVGGVVIGHVSGGQGTAFEIDFAAGATPDAVQALLQALTIANLDGHPSQRALTLSLSDGDGASLGGAAHFEVMAGPGLPTSITGSDETISIDFDGDGDLDQVTSDGGWMKLFENDQGDLVYRPDHSLSQVNVIDQAHFAALDLDGDGDQDLLVGATGGIVYRVFYNTGGVFTEGAADLFGAEGGFTRFQAVDLDSDGDLDIAAEGPGGISVFENAPSAGPQLIVNYRSVITGTAGADLMTGTPEADVLRGGDGDDIYVPDGPEDIVEETGTGTDTVRTGFSYGLGANLENLVLTGSGNIDGAGNELNNHLTGNGGANNLWGNDGDDQLEGGGGNDMLDGGSGSDAMAGGTGNDSYYLDNPGDTVSENAGEGEDTVYVGFDYILGANVENLVLQDSYYSFGSFVWAGPINGTGNAGANRITGNIEANRLEGGDGNDVLDGSLGADTMIGGAGDDSFWVYDPGDQTQEEAGQGSDTVHASISWTLGANIEKLVLESYGNDGTGNALNNTITGNGGSNTLDGAEGNDTLYGGAGGDSLLGGVGNDILNGEADDDQLYGGVGNDKLYGGDGTDQLDGGDGADQMGGGDGADTLTGGAGNDSLDGGTSADAMSGGVGNDVYYVDDAGDRAIELSGEGADIVRASVSWALGANVEQLELQGTGAIDGTGNELANRLTGNDGANTLSGLAGVDTIDGGAGGDRIIGGLGNDLLTGGSGADTFVVLQESIYSSKAPAGRALEIDFVYDLSKAEGDRLDLSAIDANANLAGDQAFTLVGAFSKAAGQMTLAYTASTNITLLSLDTDGDGKADYQMKITGDVHLDSGGWLL